MSRRVVLVAALAAVFAVKLGADVVKEWPDSAQLLDPSTTVIDRYEKECPSKKTPECAALRGAVVYSLLDALRAMADGEDTSAADVALLALDAPEPEVQLAALTVLGRTPDEPGVAARAAAILAVEERVQLQRKAAQVLERSQASPAHARLGQLWSAAHPSPDACCRDSGLAPIDWRATHPDPAALGFKPYPGARPFSVVTSDVTAGFATSDPVDKVVAFYEKGAASKPLDPNGWGEWVAAHRDAYIAKALEIMNDPDFKEMQRLTEEYQKKPDPKIIEKMTAIGERLQKKAPTTADMDPGVTALGTLPQDAGARILVLEIREGRAARLVAVHRDEVVGGTIVQMAWDRRYVPPFAPRQAP